MPSASLRIAGFANPPDWLQAAMVRTVGVEPTLPLREEDFKSPASTVPPRPLEFQQARDGSEIRGLLGGDFA